MEMFKKFDVVEVKGGSPTRLSIILSDKMDVPFFYEGEYALDIENPNVWQNTFEAYIVMNLCSAEYHVVAAHNLTLFDKNDPFNLALPYDSAASVLPLILGLKNLL